MSHPRHKVPGKDDKRLKDEVEESCQHRFDQPIARHDHHTQEQWAGHVVGDVVESLHHQENGNGGQDAESSEKLLPGALNVGFHSGKK